MSYENVLNKPVSEVSTLPVAMSAINGQYENKKRDSSGVTAKSSKKLKENDSTQQTEDKQDTAIPELSTKKAEKLKDMLQKEAQIEGKIQTGSEDATEVQTNTGEISSGQRKSENGVGKAKKANQSVTGELAGDTKRKEANSKEIINGVEDKNPYFTTSIQNNETVSKSEYKFSITQKNKKLKVAKTTVSVNDLIVESFTGQVTLIQGENSIKIDVTYEVDGELSQVTRQYTVYFEENTLIIRTNLQDGMKVTNKHIQFTATSFFNEQEYEATVQLENEQLTQTESGLFEASLHEGKNIFTLSAETNQEKTEKIIHIIYEKKKNQVAFATDLENKQVTTAEYSFYATAELNSESVPLLATLNGEKLVAKNDFYFDLLKEGKNIIELSVDVEGIKENEVYTIYYNEPQETSNQTIPDDKDGPKIVTDLKNGIQIRGSIKNINVWATTNSGKRIQANGVVVSVNGKGIGFIWDDKEKTSYKLSLREGENKIVIKAWDEEGRITTKNYKVYAKNIDEGNVIGEATISLEATTLGLGNLIPPTKVPIHEGEKASYVIDQFFRAHQFTYSHTGTLDNNFYLSAISKERITKNLKIPSDLAAMLETQAEYFNPQDYSANSLSEFTISNGSGWMYSINGDYPNYGFSDAYLLDGDVVRIRFTLFYGADIGGYGAAGNGSNEEEGASTNVWKKEW